MRSAPEKREARHQRDTESANERDANMTNQEAETLQYLTSFPILQVCTLSLCISGLLEGA